MNSLELFLGTSDSPTIVIDGYAVKVENYKNVARNNYVHYVLVFQALFCKI